RGPPGTGKTTCARIAANAIREARGDGPVSTTADANVQRDFRPSTGKVSEWQKNGLVEVTRGDLVGGYIGQSAEKTRAILDIAKNVGAIFIDEAPSLYIESEKDF